MRRESIESPQYRSLGREYLSHGTVNHSRKKYARGEVSTNMVAGYYSIFKRGMKGVYQHCAEKHQHRCLAEFDFHHNTRIPLGWGTHAMRSEKAMQSIRGKRFVYRRARSTEIN